MIPTLLKLGFKSRIVEHGDRGLFLIAQRHEAEHLPTVLLYGHGDTVPGMEGAWAANRDPWHLSIVGERLYGRGCADNKGQHSVNIAALATVLGVRGALGFNVTLLLEMGEELGSPGLRSLCRDQRHALAADVLIASDGPRLSADRPTVFLGSRGAVRLRLTLHLRDGAHHSGNWGGLISNAATVLCNAIAHCVDQNGVLRVPRLRAEPIPPAVRDALSDVAVAGEPGDPVPEKNWGEPSLTPAERVFAANTLEVLAIGSGDLRQPAAAIPGHAEAVLQLRFVVGLDWREVGPILQHYLDANGFSAVKVATIDGGNATRTLTSNTWVSWALASLERSTGKKPALLPNFGGTLPNDIFVEELALPTLWIPHSYPGCNQHAPDEHNLLPVLREGMELMAGLFWDLGATAETA
jgi:acetylornithine deacetylase/succinyl-diaminopimelate desuccinylase-like protein